MKNGGRNLDRISSIFRRQPNEQHIKQLREKYPNLENLPNLQVPKTDIEVFERLTKPQQIVDAAVQKVQSLQASALSSLLMVIDAVGSGTAGSTESQLEAITSATRLITMGFGGLHQVRKECVRNALGWPMARLCDWATPVGTETLFLDLGKRLNEKDLARSKLGRRNNNNTSYNSNNNYKK